MRGGLLVIACLVFTWLAFNVRLPSQEELEAWIDGLGWAAPFGFVALYLVVAITPIPVSVLSLAGGVLFGIAVGTTLSALGAVLGCWAAYWLARALGEQTVLRLLGAHTAKLRSRLEGAGFQAVFMLRLMPGIPYWPLNYGSGIFGVPQRDYIVASAIATIPGQLSLVSIGAFVAEPSIVRGTVVGAAWIMVIAGTLWALRRWRATRRTSTHAEETDHPEAPGQSASPDQYETSDHPEAPAGGESTTDDAGRS